jgi:hypothetical protein
MSLHDRSALILGLAQPYIDWATALDTACSRCVPN